MELLPFALHGLLLLVMVSFSGIGFWIDEIYSGGRLNLPVEASADLIELNISGMRLSSSKIYLDYNKCPTDSDTIASSKLYASDGFSLSQLVPDTKRPTSVAQFAHINIHEEGTEIIGDIGATEDRAGLGRKLSMVSLGLSAITLLIFGFKRIIPASIISSAQDGVSQRDESISRTLNWLILLSAGSLWLSIVIYSSIIPTLLAHLFREARDRCNIAFQSGDEQFEIRTMGSYVRDHADPNGVSIILYSISIGTMLLYSLFLFLKANRKPVNSLNLSPHQMRNLPWYCHIFPWKATLLLTAFSILVSFWVMNLTKARGYSINNFYWKYGSKVAQKTGLSRTGTLLDFVQKVFSLVAVPEGVMAATTYMWLAIVPMLAGASKRPLCVLSKGFQDFAILLLVRACVAWVTIAPTTLSMLEKPECFVASDEDSESWSWLAVFDTRQSCNDTMFSITVTVVGVPAIILIYYVGYAGVVRGVYSRIVSSYIGFCAAVACAVAVISRHQYSSDIVVGISVVLLYMLAQTAAFKLLFETHDAADETGSRNSLMEKIIPILEECKYRLKTYSQASSELKGLKASSHDFHEIGFLYRSVGLALKRAREGKPVTELTPEKE